MATLQDIPVESITGEPQTLRDYAGKVLLVVNVASKCGLTPQYEGLEKLYADKRDKGLVVLGFPANDFGAQEPGTNEEIGEFCKKNYGVTFPMAGKVSVKGDDTDPLFKWLVEQSNEMAKNLPTNTSRDLAWRDYLRNPITWNFTKFLIDENGNLIAVFHNKVNPMSEEITKYLN